MGIGRACPLHRLEDPRASRGSLAQDAPSPIDLQRERLQGVEGLVHVSMELTFDLLADCLGVADGNLLDPLEVREVHRAIGGHHGVLVEPDVVVPEARVDAAAAIVPQAPRVQGERRNRGAGHVLEEAFRSVEGYDSVHYAYGTRVLA